MNYEDYYDDYDGEEGGFIKNKGRKKKKFKGRPSVYLIFH